MQEVLWQDRTVQVPHGGCHSSTIVAVDGIVRQSNSPVCGNKPFNRYICLSNRCKLCESHSVLLLQHPGRKFPKEPQLLQGSTVEKACLVVEYHEHLCHEKVKEKLFVSVKFFGVQPKCYRNQVL